MTALNLGGTLRAILAASAPVAAQLGGAGNGFRVYPNQAPQNCQRPYVTYYRVSTTERSASLDNRAAKLEWARFTFDCRAETYADADKVEDAIRAALDGYAGTPSGGKRIIACRRIDRRDDHEADVQPKTLYLAGADYSVNAEI